MHHHQNKPQSNSWMLEVVKDVTCRAQSREEVIGDL